MPSNKIPWEEFTIASAVFLPKVHILNLIMKKHQTNQSWRTFYKAAGLKSSTIQGQETERDVEEVAQIRH